MYSFCMRKGKRTVLSLLFLFLCSSIGVGGETSPSKSKKIVYILPIRQDIAPPLVYLVRRGVKEAIAAGADALILDMDTNGGYADATLEIIDILDRFPGKKITYVNKKAYSAGAFIAVATEQIYMAPESVIGAAAPIFIGPGGSGPQQVPSTLEAKIISALSARIRAYAQKYGHNPRVIEAMIDKNKELKIDGKVICAKGEILTLTNQEAEQRYGNPPKPLLSLGTVKSLDALLERLGYANAKKVYVQPTGAEKLAQWLTSLSWLWLIIGIAGIYIEMKTPGFGVPGTIGIIAFILYFAGSYIAGFAGLEWALVFLAGLILIALEIFVWPGVMVLLLSGGLLCLLGLVMALVDRYPHMPLLPTLDQLERPLETLSIAILGAGLTIYILSRLLPKTPVYTIIVQQGASATESVQQIESWKQTHLGQVGVAVSPLRPSGKARFGNELLDVTTEGEFIPSGARVRIIGFSGKTAIVEEVEGTE